MATFTITAAPAVAQRIVDAFAGVYDYQTQIDDPANPGTLIANPETKAQFTLRKLREHARDVVRTWEVRQANATTIATASAKVDAEIIIT